MGQKKQAVGIEEKTVGIEEKTVGTEERMKNYEQYKRLMRIVFCCILLAAQTGIFLYVWKDRYSLQMEIPFWRKGHWLIGALYLFLIFVFPRIYGGWRVGYLRIFNIIYSQFLGTVMANLSMYVVIALLTKRLENPGMLFLMTGIQTGLIVLWGIGTTKLYQKAYPARRVLLIYGERPAAWMAEKLKTRRDRFEIGETVHISGKIEDIEQKAERYTGVIICDIPSKERNRILKFCYGKGIRTYVTPKISDLIIRSAETQHMFDSPLFMSRNMGFTIEQRAVKRAIDIILSMAAFVLATPIMAAVALCIRMEDGGSILYRQKRLTQGGKEFYLYKFRSMRENAEGDGIARLAGEHDARITKVGSVIRAIRLDELPQLFNIIKGDMSLVGPRPERPEIAARYVKDIPEFSYRLKVRAGLTGYAQVYGTYHTTAYDKLKLDLMYIQNYSLRLDFEIMLKTVQILFMRESAKGVTEEWPADQGERVREQEHV